jgi:hypothetical protein
MPVLVDLDPAGPGQLWTSLGMPARAAFVLTVSAPHRPKPDTELAPPAESIDLKSDTFGKGTGVPGGESPTSPAVEKRWKRVGTGVQP